LISLSKQLWGAPVVYSLDERRYNSHNILLSKSYVARAVGRRSLLLRHDRITQCGNDEESLYIAALFLLLLSTVSLAVLPDALPGILVSSSGVCGELLRWSTANDLMAKPSQAKPSQAKPSQGVI
jgi:hypothetical protein